mgnify:CR=1 FL=1
MKALIRDLTASVLDLLPSYSSFEKVSNRLFIATFHRVLPENQLHDYPLPSLAISTKQFEWFMEFFLQNFDCQRLDNAWKHFVAGGHREKPLLAITFDDGQLDNYLHAAPVLNKFCTPATFFVPTEAIESRTFLWHDRMAYAIRSLGYQQPRSVLLTELGLSVEYACTTPRLGVMRAKNWDSRRRDDWISRAEMVVRNSIPDWDGMMDWVQVRELAGLGHEIGSHSYSHPILDQCNDRELYAETVESRRMIEAEIGQEVSSFCYPNGNFDHRVAECVRGAGYKVAVGTQWGSNRYNDNPFSLKRHDMVTANSINRHGNMSRSRVRQRMLGVVRGASK